MTNPVTAAAARLRRLVWIGVPTEVVEAVRIVTDCVLAEHADDDDQPIDEAWLLSVGARKQDDWVLFLSAPRAPVIEFWPEDAIVRLGYSWLSHIKTRGDFRALCRLLGIALPAKENGL